MAHAEMEALKLRGCLSFPGTIEAVWYLEAGWQLRLCFAVVNCPSVFGMTEKEGTHQD